MPKLAVLGATLKCNKGSKTCSLTPSMADTVVAGPGVAATMLDFVVGTNIVDFGECDVAPKKCSPITPLPWEIVWTNALAGAAAAVTKESKLRCFKTGGAEITVTYAGQETIDCLSPGYRDPNARFDATYVDSKGVAVILNNVTQAELDEYKERDQVQAMLDELDAYRADPLGYALGEVASGFAKGGKGVVEGRANNRRNMIPVTRAR